MDTGIDTTSSVARDEVDSERRPTRERRRRPISVAAVTAVAVVAAVGLVSMRGTSGTDAPASPTISGGTTVTSGAAIPMADPATSAPVSAGGVADDPDRLCLLQRPC
jgi:hypothetical protein